MPRVSVSLHARSALVFGWVLSVLLAAGLGAMFSRIDRLAELDELAELRHTPATVARVGTAGLGPVKVTAQHEPVASFVTERLRREPDREETIATRAPVTTPAPTSPEVGSEAEHPDPSPRPAPVPAPEPAASAIAPSIPPAETSVPDPLPDPLPVAPREIEEVPEPADGNTAAAIDLLAEAERADRLAEVGDLASARDVAVGLFAAHPSYTDLVAALEGGGADETEARLRALRVLQVAGHDSISRELARELKRSYAGTEQVADSIWEWGILSPRITSVRSAIEGGRELVVIGRLENPDIGEVRRIRVEVEALDAGGNLLGKVEIRVRPRVLGAGLDTGFRAVFTSLDPTAVLRTRATVIKWESEILNAG